MRNPRPLDRPRAEGCAEAVVPLSEEQQYAYAQITDFIQNQNRDYYVLNGLAGTGKTTVLSHIGKEFGLPMCSFTGKAASVLYNKTGLAACTIHSYFYECEKHLIDGQVNLHFEDKFEAGELFGKVMLLDECSMVNRSLARDMLRTGMKIVACGDPGQLPPVVGEQFFNCPDFTLKEPHRQALESPIIRQAYQVRNGNHYQSDGEGFQVIHSMPREQLLEADAIIVYTNRTRRDLTIMIRELHGHARKYPQAGEPVMCLKNYKDFGLFNGAVYTLLEPFNPDGHHIVLDKDGQRIVVSGVEFECIPSNIPYEMAEPNTRFDFGYVITCHKAQGSEWKDIVIIDEYPLWRDERTRWLYTAITRASEKVSILPNY